MKNVILPLIAAIAISLSFNTSAQEVEVIEEDNTVLIATIGYIAGAAVTLAVAMAPVTAAPAITTVSGVVAVVMGVCYFYCDYLIDEDELTEARELGPVYIEL